METEGVDAWGGRASCRLWRMALMLPVCIVVLRCGTVATARDAGRVIGDGVLQAMMYIAGVTDAEDLETDMVEELSGYLSSPLDINSASLSRLTGSGLFSQYQAVSLLDYRERSGDVLSLAELAAVDGFGKDCVRALSYFITLDSSALPGHSSTDKGRTGWSMTLKSGTRRKEHEETEYSYAYKCRLEVKDRFEAGITGRTSYGMQTFPPEVMSFSLAYYGRKRLGKFIAGDFNARFGQGLAMWSGFTMGGAGTPESFSKRPSGISPYRSYSGEGSLRGIAADFSAGRFTVAAFLASDGLREMMNGEKDAALSFIPAVNIGYFGRNGQASFTCYAQTEDILQGHGHREAGTVRTGMADMKCSADMRYVVKGTELFSEVALDVNSLSVAALAGSRFSAGEHLDMAVSLRYYPSGYSPSRSGAVRSGTKCSNEYAVSASGSFAAGSSVGLAGKEGFGSTVSRHRGVFSVDISHAPEPRYGTDRATSQMKLLFDYDWQVSSCFSLSFRVTERLRTWGDEFRTDARADILYSSGPLSLSARLNALLCEDLALLGYAEGGYRKDMFSVYLRGGAFKVDNWDDRIYVYERDAPGNFNVPAFYGRGWWAALTAGVKCTRWCRAYLRAFFMDCPWPASGTGEKKPGKAELKLQVVISL